MFLLNNQDTELLRGYITSLKELADGKRLPGTDKQVHFVQVVNGMGEPKTNYEHAYLRFMALPTNKQNTFIEKFGRKNSRKLVSKPKRKKRTKKKMTSREQQIHETHRLSGYYNIRATFVRG